jgi:hypothetical protein
MFTDRSDVLLEASSLRAQLQLQYARRTARRVSARNGACEGRDDLSAARADFKRAVQILLKERDAR